MKDIKEIERIEVNEVLWEKRRVIEDWNYDIEDRLFDYFNDKNIIVIIL